MAKCCLCLLCRSAFFLLLAPGAAIHAPQAPTATTATHEYINMEADLETYKAMTNGTVEQVTEAIGTAKSCDGCIYVGFGDSNSGRRVTEWANTRLAGRAFGVSIYRNDTQAPEIPFTLMTATQSSTGYGGNADKALVRYPQTSWPGTCTHTNRDAQAWWKVSLGSEYKVSSVKLTNRANCCPDRLQRVNIFVGTINCASEVVVDEGATKTIECVGTGSEIKIQAPDTRYLTLCGFAAYGVKDQQNFVIYATEAADVTVRKASPTHQGAWSIQHQVFVQKGHFTRISGNYVGELVQIESTGNVLVSLESTGADYVNLVPAAQQIFGTCSTNCKIVVFNATSETIAQEVSKLTITEECSDGSSRTYTGNYVYTVASTGYYYSGKACKWTAPSGTRISGHSWADNNGGDGTAWLPPAYSQLVTPVPVAMDWVKIISDQEAMCRYDSVTFTLQGRDGVFTHRLAQLGAGTVITCNSSVQVFGDEAVNDDEFQLIVAKAPQSYLHYAKLGNLCALVDGSDSKFATGYSFPSPDVEICKSYCTSRSWCTAFEFLSPTNQSSEMCLLHLGAVAHDRYVYVNPNPRSIDCYVKSFYMEFDNYCVHADGTDANQGAGYAESTLEACALRCTRLAVKPGDRPCTAFEWYAAGWNGKTCFILQDAIAEGSVLSRWRDARCYVKQTTTTTTRAYLDHYGYVNMEADLESHVATQDGVVVQHQHAIGANYRCNDCIYVGFGESNRERRVTEWASTGLAGKEFVLRAYRNNPQIFVVYAIEDSVVSVLVGTAWVTSFRLSKGEIRNISGSYANLFVQIESSGNILVSQESTGADYVNLAPAAQTIFGTCSTVCHLVVFNGSIQTALRNQVITQECSDGSRSAYSNNYYHVIPNSGSQYTGIACKWTAPEGVRISGHSWADNDGGDGVSFLPAKYFQRVTPIPLDMEFIKLISDQKATCSVGLFLYFTLQGSNGVYTSRPTRIPRGSVIRCDSPVQAFGDEAVTHDEFQLIAPDACLPGIWSLEINASHYCGMEICGNHLNTTLHVSGYTRCEAFYIQRIPSCSSQDTRCQVHNCSSNGVLMLADSMGNKVDPGTPDAMLGCGNNNFTIVNASFQGQTDCTCTNQVVKRGLILDFQAARGVNSTMWENQVQGGPDATVPSQVSYNEVEKAFHIPGAGSVISVPIATNPTAMTAVTYSAWVKPLDSSTIGWVVSQAPDYGWSRAVTIRDSRLGGTGVTPGQVGFTNRLGNMPLGEWSHVVGVWSSHGGPCSVFLNNKKSTGICGNGQSSNVANEVLLIGGRGQNDAGHNPEILISDVAVFNVSLTDSEVQMLYNRGRSSMGQACFNNAREAVDPQCVTSFGMWYSNLCTSRPPCTLICDAHGKFVSYSSIHDNGLGSLNACQKAPPQVYDNNLNGWLSLSIRVGGVGAIKPQWLSLMRGNWTIAGWFKYERFDGLQTTLIGSYGPNHNTNRFTRSSRRRYFSVMALPGGDPLVKLKTLDSDVVTISVAFGTWFQAAVVFDSDGTTKFYHNGVLKGTRIFNWNDQQLPIMDGELVFCGGHLSRTLPCKASDIGIWSRSLSPSELMACTPSSSDMFSYYSLNGVFGSVGGLGEQQTVSASQNGRFNNSGAHGCIRHGQALATTTTTTTTAATTTTTTTYQATTTTTNTRATYATETSAYCSPGNNDGDASIISQFRSMSDCETSCSDNPACVACFKGCPNNCGGCIYRSVSTCTSTPSGCSSYIKRKAVSTIRMHTCDRSHAQTDHTISLRINDGAWKVLDNPGNDHERNQWDEYTLFVRPNKIELRNGGSDGWCLDRIEVDGVSVTSNLPIWLDNPCTQNAYSGIPCAAFATWTVQAIFTKTLASAARSGATQISVSDTTSLVVGMELVISGAQGAETKSIIAISNRRLAGNRRSLAPGTVTLDSALLYSYPASGTTLTFRLGVQTTTAAAVPGSVSPTPDSESGGANVGLIFGLLIPLLGTAGVLVFCFRKRRAAMRAAALARVAPVAAPAAVAPVAPVVVPAAPKDEPKKANTKVQVLDEEKHHTNTVRRESIPQYWTSNNEAATDHFDQMVYVSMEAFDGFNELLTSTYRPIATQDRPCPKKAQCKKTPGGCPCVKPGGDPGLPTGFVVRRVIRVEEADMWARYVNKRDSIKARRSDCGRPLDPPIFTKEVVKKHEDIFSQLDDQINEVYLWHGTHVRVALQIAQNDFNIDLAGSGTGTMYGRGTYMAESCTKADEYARDEEGGYYDSVYAMVLCRVVLGKYFYTTQRDEEAQKKVTAGDFDSTCGDRAKSVNTYRELVVYDKDQIYPEFVVLYNRLLQKDDEAKIREMATYELFHMQLPVYWNNCHVDPVKTGFRVHYNVKKHTLELIQRLVKGACSKDPPTVTRVRRVEDSEMWTKYVDFRAQVVARTDKPVHIQELDGDASSGHCITEALLDDEDLQEQAISVENLDARANELLLWHGTSKEAAEAIAEDGFQISTDKAKHGKRFGEGAYLAEDLNKSLSYAPQMDGIQYVLLCRTVCGDMYYTESGSETLAHLHARNNQKDSVLANPRKAGPREFIVLQACQVYPEFILEVKR